MQHNRDLLICRIRPSLFSPEYTLRFICLGFQVTAKLARIADTYENQDRDIARLPVGSVLDVRVSQITLTTKTVAGRLDSSHSFIDTCSAYPVRPFPFFDLPVV